MLTENQFVLKGTDFHTMYKKALIHIYDNHEFQGKFATAEFMTLILLDPRKSFINLRKNWAWCLNEGINRLSFESDELINPGTAWKFRPNWAKKLKAEGGKFCYSYGEVFKKQVPEVIKKMRKSVQKEAIINIWKEDYLLFSGLYPRRPCTLTIHLYEYAKRLCCHVTMRTSDILNLLPYDVFHHTLLQKYIASELKMPLGSFIFSTPMPYFHKKRLETGSLHNTIDKLGKVDSPQYIDSNLDTNWQMNFGERKVLMGLIESMEKNPNKHFAQSLITKFNTRGDISRFTRNYAKALIYCNYQKLFKNKTLKQSRLIDEFQVIYR